MSMWFPNTGVGSHSFLSPGHLPNPGIKLGSSALRVDSLSYEPPGNPGEVDVQIIEMKSSFIIGLSMYSMFDIKMSLYIRQKSFFKSDLIS